MKVSSLTSQWAVKSENWLFHKGLLPRLLGDSEQRFAGWSSGDGPCGPPLPANVLILPLLALAPWQAVRKPFKGSRWSRGLRAQFRVCLKREGWACPLSHPQASFCPLPFTEQNVLIAKWNRIFPPLPLPEICRSPLPSRLDRAGLASYRSHAERQERQGRRPGGRKGTDHGLGRKSPLSFALPCPR